MNDKTSSPSIFLRTLLTVAGVPVLIFSTAGVSAATPLLMMGSAILDAGNGSVIVSGNGTTSGCINWYNTTAPTTCPDVGGTGDFTVNGGSTAPFTPGETGTIQDLSFQTTYPLVDFLDVSHTNGDVFFDLEDIRFNGGAAIGDCSAGANDPGATCTPADSPFQLTNGLGDPNNGGVVDTVSVAFTVDAWGYRNSSGTNYDEATPYVGTFTTQEAIQGATIQSLLNAIAGGGSITASWSATFTPEAPTSLAPEPVTFLLLGAGLTVIGCFKRKARKV
ncbi:MAG TPA: hypothetical protein VGL82_17895 [Bryobacteraceae bacterium]|jgi:hypothetical protein